MPARAARAADRSGDRRRPAGAHHQAGHGQAARRDHQPRVERRSRAASAFRRSSTALGSHLLRRRRRRVQNSTCGGAKGCAASLSSPSADGKDKITVTLSEGNNPIVHVDAKFDVHVPLELDYGGELVCISANGSCTLDIASQHFNDASQQSARDRRRHPDRHRSGDGRADAQPGQHRRSQNLGLDISGCSVIGASSTRVISFFNTTIGNAAHQPRPQPAQAADQHAACSRSCRSRRASPARSTPARCSPASTRPRTPTSRCSSSPAATSRARAAASTSASCRA